VIYITTPHNPSHNKQKKSTSRHTYRTIAQQRQVPIRNTHDPHTSTDAHRVKWSVDQIYPFHSAEATEPLHHHSQV
jgi:hypothetical protein